MLNILQLVDFFCREGKDLIMQQEIITSLDFGTQKLSATVAIREKDELKILGVQSCKSAGIEKGLLLDIDKCRDVAVSLLKDLEKRRQ